MSLKPSKAIPSKNKSPYGWWIASLVERFEYYDEDKNNLNRRCLAWVNTILIQAHDREEAYRKALEYGSYSEGSEAWDDTGRKGCWRFEGIATLLPIYDQLEDGAELLWEEHENRSVKTVQSWVRQKEELETFIDDP